MKLKTKLNGYIAHQWEEEAGVSVVGSAFIKTRFLNSNSLLQKFIRVETVFEFKNLLQQLNGEFSVVINKTNLKCFAVNHTRKFPLLYQQNENEILVTDQVDYKAEFNQEQISIFKKLYTTNHRFTLYNNWFSLLYNEFGYIEQKQLTISRYEEFFPEHKISKSLEEIDHEWNQVFLRILPIIDNRPVYITLSGGYDSRLILCKLLEYVPKDRITTFTYGIKYSNEVITAQKVAKKLGVRNLFIPYNQEQFSYFFSPDFQKYILENHHATQLPTEQTVYAVHYLKQNHLIPKNTIVLNGIYGDIIAGSALTKPKIKHPKRYIFKNYGVKVGRNFYLKSSTDNYENWRYENRVFKFISCANAGIESLGFKVCSPLGDKNWVALWSEMPKKDRLNAHKYQEFMFEKYFIPLGVDFRRANPNAWHHFKQKIKSILPVRWIKGLNLLLAKSNKNKGEDNNYQDLTNEIADQLNLNHVHYKGFNDVYTEYFLKLIREKK